MKISDTEKQNILRVLIGFLSDNPNKNRKEIMNGVLQNMGFSASESKAVHSPTAKINMARSMIGTMLNDLVSKGDIIFDKENSRYHLSKEDSVVVKESECRSEIFRILQKRSVKKSDLYSSLQKKFGTDKTKTDIDDNSLKSIAGQILYAEKTSGKILENNGIISLADSPGQKSYPTAPLPEELFEKAFLSRLNDMGGAFFERFVANMLEKYFLISGRDVLACDVQGGSEDGGIDVVIETEEDLGFVEKIMIQTKNRKSIPVTEKEVREFYGAINVQNGTRGIFVTTSSFHSSADKLLRSIPNCVGIDGKKLFTLVKRTAYGIHKTQNGYTFDNIIFTK